MSSNISLRPAKRSDISTIARITNAANAKSAVHKRVAPGQDRYPIDYYQWRLHIVRERFTTPDVRTIIAEDTSSGKALGLASWAVEGSDTALYKRWVSQGTWMDWFENNVIWAEKTWFRWVRDRSIDYKFLESFVAAFKGPEHPARPACLHLHLIVVDPTTQSKGVGRVLMDWGKELSMREQLPIFLESNLEATGFYEKGGFSRMTKDLVVKPDGQDSLPVPVYVWEGEQREGRWLERDLEFAGAGARWRWKDSVLPK